MTGGGFRFETQHAGFTGEAGRASVLTEAAPQGDYVVQTAVRLDVPLTGVHDYVQGGLAIYGSDERLLKLTHVSVGPTRVTEFGKLVPAGAPGYPRYGAVTGGPPASSTWLRIVKRTSSGHTLFTSYTSRDGRRWVRGATWAYDELATAERIGLLSLGGTGFTSTFDHVRVWSLAN